MALHHHRMPELWFCVITILWTSCSTVIATNDEAEEPSPSVETLSIDEPVPVQISLQDDSLNNETRSADDQTITDKTDPEEEAQPVIGLCGIDSFPVLYVNPLSKSDTIDGLSWETAFNKIQPAIDKANTLAETCQTKAEVWVSVGNYYLYTEGADYGILVSENVHLYGGFTGKETALSARNPKDAQTTLDARPDAQSNLRLPHIVVAENGSRIDGFFLTGAHAAGDGIAGKGAALITANASVQIRNNVFVGNVSSETGGAIFASDSELSIENCRFESNFSEGDGGAVALENATAQISDSYLLENSASGYGGALFLMNASLTIEKSVFMANNAIGGGVISAGDSEIHITNALLADNTAFFGGALYMLNSESLSVLNCTFADNYAQDSGASIKLDLGNNNAAHTIINSIFAGGYPTEFDINDYSNGGAAVTVQFSNVEGGYAGEGNIDAAPAFATNSYELTEESPCVNTALDEMAPDDDINGNPRTSADMGAYEL